MLDIGTLITVYGSVVDFKTFKLLLKDYLDDLYLPYLNYLTDYTSYYKDTKASTKYAYNVTNGNDFIIINITFSTIELFMPKEWRILDKAKRQEVRLCDYKNLINRLPNMEYSEGNTLMGHCKWFITFSDKIPMTNMNHINLADIIKYLVELRITE